MHQLGQKCQICESFQGWGTLQDLGKDPEPRVHEKISEEQAEKRVAYEVSVSKLELASEEEQGVLQNA